MIVIGAGSRTIRDRDERGNIIEENYKLVEDWINGSGWNITLLRTGGALGMDRLFELWAKRNNVPNERILPDWNKFGKSAGYRRNVEMAEGRDGVKADGLLLIWDGQSKGSQHMKNIATERGIEIFEAVVKEYN